MSNHNPIQLLIDEHDIISTTEAVVQSLHGSWENNAGEYAEKVRHLVIFFREYSDQFHHHKEEEVLFRKLKQHPDFLLKDILSELEQHHEMFRESVAEIEDAVKEEEWPRVQKLLERYMNELLDHIAVENDELFSMAESIFSPEELEHIYFLFEDIDRDLGLERKRALVEELKSI